MIHFRFRFLCLSMVFLAAPAAYAQVPADAAPDGAQASESESEQSSAGVSPSKADFQQKFVAWRNAIKQIDLLRVEYQTADEAGRQELQKKLQAQFEEANAMVPGVIEAAITAFKEAEGNDDELMKFLVAVAAHRVSSDLYEEALPVIEVLATEGAGEGGIPMLGGIAAFSVGEYDAARKHFARAEEAGVFSEPPKSQDERELNLWQLAMSVRDILDEHQKAWEREQAIRAAEAEADDLPRVLLKTTKGDITIELFENEAPNTVKNFITLVEQGAYDGTDFHRVLGNFMAQGGDPTTAGKPPLDYTIPCECYEPEARKHFRGSLSMAHAGRDTGNAQFFLTFRPTPHLDGRTFYPDSPGDAHTVFGRVIEGLSVLADLNRVNPAAPPERGAQPEPDEITEATVLRKRPNTNYADFEKLSR